MEVPVEEEYHPENNKEDALVECRYKITVVEPERGCFLSRLFRRRRRKSSKDEVQTYRGKMPLTRDLSSFNEKGESPALTTNMYFPQDAKKVTMDEMKKLKANADERE